MSLPSNHSQKLIKLNIFEKNWVQILKEISTILNLVSGLVELPIIKYTRKIFVNTAFA